MIFILRITLNAQQIMKPDIPYFGFNFYFNASLGAHAVHFRILQSLIFCNVPRVVSLGGELRDLSMIV